MVDLDPAVTTIGLPLDDQHEHYLAFEYLLIRHNPRTGSHELLVLLSWQDDSVSTLTAPTILHSYDSIRHSVARGPIHTNSHTGSHRTGEAEERYQLTKTELLNALLGLDNQRCLHQGPEGLLSQNLGSDLLTILHTAHSTRSVRPQYEGAIKLLRVETLVLRQEYPTTHRDPAHPHWGKSVCWPNSFPLKTPTTEGPTWMWMGVREFVAAQPYHTRPPPTGLTYEVDATVVGALV